MLEQRHRHVAGAAAEVEGDGFGALEDGLEETGGARPPGAVDTGGEEVVGAVVGGSDGVEHLLNVRGGGLLGGDASGAGSGSLFVFGRRNQIRLRAFFAMLTTTRWENTKMSIDRRL